MGLFVKKNRRIIPGECVELLKPRGCRCFAVKCRSSPLQVYDIVVIRLADEVRILRNQADIAKISVHMCS